MSSLHGLTLAHLSANLGLSQAELGGLAGSAPRAYEERELPKKTGGWRSLLVPTARLKGFQRRFYRTYLRRHTYHASAYCVPRLGALAAVQRHRGHGFLLHLDLDDFFPSVDHHRVLEALLREEVDRQAARTLTRLVTVHAELPQGAPTSVAIGNLVLHRLDLRLSGLCDSSGAGLTYTRYVDDLIISGGSRLERFEGTIRRIVQGCGWTVNDRARLLRPDEEHRVLGIIAGPTLAVGEEYLTDLRRTLSHLRAGKARIAPECIQSLRGKIAWVATIDPHRGRRLRSILDGLAAREDQRVPALLLHDS